MRISEFSDRMQLTESFQETIENVSQELKLEIWNEVVLNFAQPGKEGFLKNQLFIKAFATFFGISAEQVRFSSHVDFTQCFQPFFMKLNGVKFYNLLNYLSKKIRDSELIILNKRELSTIIFDENSEIYKEINDRTQWRFSFSDIVNTILENKGSPCCFTNSFDLTLITNSIELESLNESMQTPFVNTVNMHMEKAASELFKGNTKECCDEAYSTIESLLKKITGKDKGDFGKLIDQLAIDPALKSAVKSGWGFASNRARHGQNEDSYKYPTKNEAKFILVFASAVINLLIAM